ncbi:MAG: hypothetical protein AB8G05_13285 [Oligoflexales bacterium]
MKNGLFVKKLKKQSNETPVTLAFGGCSKNDKKDGKEGKDGDVGGVVKPTEVKADFQF